MLKTLKYDVRRHHRRIACVLITSCLLCLLLLGLALTGSMPCCARQEPRADNPHQALIQWVLDNGGKADVRIQQVNAEDLRGTVATRAFQAGDVIVSLPQALGVALLSTDYTAAELAFALMWLRHRHARWWAFMRPYWDSLPAPGEVLREQSYPDHLLALLQDEAMAAVAHTERDFTQRLYNGTAPLRYEQGSLGEEFPGLNVSAAEFMHWATVIGSYSFAFQRPRDGVWLRFLLPLLGSLNHAGPDQATARVHWDHATGAFQVVARRPIGKGEEVTHTYNHSLQRNDAALMKYGFIQRNFDPPRLCGVDLPGGVLGDTYEGPMWEHWEGGPLATRPELRRLQRILAGFPTTAEQDAALLAGGSLGSWQRLFVEFRMLRKRALQHTIDSLTELFP